MSVVASAVEGSGHVEAGVEGAMWRLLRLGRVDARSRRARVDGARLHWLEAGDGPDIVLLQGAGGGAANWYRIMGSLAREYRVRAPDLPGFGLSEPMRRLSAPLGRRTADVIRRWLDAIGVRGCAVVGTSFGGLVAVRLAQRPDSPVNRLALLDSTGLGRELPVIVRLAALPLVGPVVLRPSRRGTAWLFRRLLTTNRRRIGPEHEHALVDYLYATSAAGDHHRLARALRLFAGPRGQTEVLGDAELGALALPVLVVWGARDRFLPVAHARRAAALLPHAELRLLTDVGHSPNWEAPDAMVDALTPFLRG